ncbi:MAG: HAD family hydrolase [Chitinophagaceae bacterium]
MKQIKAIIFDLDGTIADTLPLCIAAFRKSIEPLAARTITDEEIIATFGPSEEGTILALAPDHYEEGVAAYLQHYKELHGMCPVPFAGITELLDQLLQKGVKVAMVTGKGQHSTVISLEQFGLTNHFELLETGSPAGPRKAEGIANILQQWPDIAPEETWYVGDAPSDIIASRKAGIPVVAAAWAATAEPEKLISLQPGEIFYSIADFTKWVLERV